MAIAPENVLELTATTGAGTYSLAGPPDANWRSFVSGAGADAQVYYVARNSDGKKEFGIGTVASGTPDTLTRDTIIESSSAGAAVNWQPADGQVYVHSAVSGQAVEKLLFGYADFWADGGAADAYDITPSPKVTELVAGMTFKTRIANANLTTTPTLTVNGLAARTIVLPGGAAVPAGRLPAAAICTFVYDATGDRFQLVSMTQGLGTAEGDVPVLQAGGLLDPARVPLLAAATELTIDAGSITPTANYHSVDTEADGGNPDGVAADEVTTISTIGLYEGAVLTLRAEDAARVVTVKDGIGNVALSEGDFVLDDLSKRLVLQRRAAGWDEVSRSFDAKITDWVEYTPTFTGFGVASGVSIWSRRVGDTLEIRGKFTLGVPTAVEARMTLGFSGTDANVTSDTSKVPSIQAAGPWWSTAPVALSGHALIESNVGYITFGYMAAGVQGLAKLNASTVGSTGQTLSLNASIPISGW
ncbi:hypothetical protein [Pelagibius sp.]|uniref:hypothetical protein n=1 Tax=Pelagibius sp. TaxID=1931238 RepID=UPI003BAE63D8